MTLAKSLTRVSEEERDVLARYALSQLDERFKADPWTWMREAVITVDEASQAELRWPAHLEYTRDLIEILRGEQLIAIPKSRRMMVSWTVAAYCAHRARYFPHNVIYWQADNEDKAAAIVDGRVRFIEDHLQPAALRRAYESWRTSSGAVGTIRWKDTGSKIEGIASGPDKIRSYTPSIFVMDESDFHQRGQESLAAGLACVEKNAQLIVISSSNGPGRVLADICKKAGFSRWKGGLAV